MGIVAIRASPRSMTMPLRYAVEALSHSVGSIHLVFGPRVQQIAEVDPRDENSESSHARGVALEGLRMPLIGYFRKRVQQQDDVHDLVQEVFLRLTSRGSLDTIDSLRSYAFQVAESVLTDRLRRRIVRHQDAHVEFDPEHMGEADIAPDRILVGRAALKAALVALNQLPERTRTIFVLRRLEGMRYLEISKRLGISVSAVEKHMVRAVAHLATCEDLR